MKLKICCILFCLAALVRGNVCYAQDEKVDRVLVLLDGSAGMKLEWSNGQTKYDAASQAIAKLIDSIYAVNEDVQFGLRLFGNQYPEVQANCKDSRLEVRFTKDNAAQMALRLKDIRPTGVAALSYGLQEALRADVADTHYRQSIVVITGNVYSCAGDICKMLSEANAKMDFYRVYVMDYAGVGHEFTSCADRVFRMTDAEFQDAAISLVASQFVRKKRQARQEVVAAPEVKPQPPTVKMEVALAKLAVKPRQLKGVISPTQRPVSLIPVPAYIPPVEPEPEQTEVVETIEQPITPVEQPAEEEVEEVAPIPQRTSGSLVFISSGAVTDLKIYRMHRGNDVYVKRLKITSAGQQEIELENGSYKMTYQMSDGTEITQPFRIGDEELTEITSR